MNPRLAAFLARPSVGAGLTAVVFALGFLASVFTDWTRWLYGALALAATMAAYFTNEAVQQREHEQIATAEQLAESVRVKEHGAIASSVVPLLRLVNQIHEEPDPGERRALRGQAVTGVLNACAAACGPIGEVRACWYALDVDPGGTVRGLRYVAYAGRADEPRVRFDSSTVTGRQVLASLLADERVFVADVHATRPPAWSAQEVASGHYVAFLAVPVRGERQVHGMLTIDSQHGGILVAERDEPLILMLARVLAAALAERFEDDP